MEIDLQTWSAEPLRILIVSFNFYPPVIGGAERWAALLAEEFARQKCDVQVLSRWDQRERGWSSKNGVRIGRCIRTINRGPLFGLSLIVSTFLWMVRMRKNYDVVYVNHLYLTAFAAVLAGKLLGKLVVCVPVSGGTYGDVVRLRKKKGSWLLLSVLKKTDYVIAASLEIAADLAEAGFPEQKLCRIPWGIDAKQFVPASEKAQQARKIQLGFDDSFVVLFVGRFHRKKGVPVLLEAWKRVEPAKNIVLVIAGFGEEEPAIRRRISELELEESVCLFGPATDLEGILRAADVFVIPSLSEGLPVVLLEAMAAALPTVATQTGGIPEVITDNVDGLLVPVGDPDELAKALKRLIEDADLRRRLGYHARARIESKFSIQLVADSYLSLFKTEQTF